MDLAGTVLLILVALVMVAMYALVIRRLLGARVGAIRTIAVTVLALYLAPVLLTAMSTGAGLGSSPGGPGDDTGLRGLFLVLSVLAATTAALVVLVVLEILVPTGSVPGPWTLSRVWKARSARAGRYAQIVRIAARHGLGRFLRGQRHPGLATPEGRQQIARSLREALEEGGVSFVKLGQFLSTRRDLISAEFVTELATLQDSATPLTWAQVSAVLEAELGVAPEAAFADVTTSPMAAASVGQVHAARLLTGEDVVVKVQRPDIDEALERDLDIIAAMATTLERRSRWGRSFGLRALADGFAASLREELDFTVERDNMRTFAAALSSGSVRVPTPCDDLCTRRVLVMEKLPGTPLGSAAQVLRALGDERRRELATALLGSVVEPMLSHGLFHADPHPGNVLVTDDGTLGLLDFGSVGRLDGTTRDALAGLLLALDRMDSLAATDALIALVDHPDDIDERALERSLGQIMVRFGSPGAPVGADAFTALFRLVTRAGLSVPPEVAAVFRALATVEGTLATAAPSYDVVEGARQIGRDRFARTAVPPRARKLLEDEFASLLPMLRRLPRRVDRIADTIEHGRLRTRISLFADPAERRTLTELVHQVLLTLLGATAGIMAVILASSDAGPRITPTLTLYAVVGYCLFISSIVLVLRVLIVIFRRD